MRIVISHVVQYLLWLLISTLVLLALVITALRVVLPHMNQYQASITEWIEHQTGIETSVDEVGGTWKNTSPSLSLQGVKAHLPDGSDISLHVDSIDLEFDLLKSLLQWQPVIANLKIHNLRLDISSVDLMALYDDEELAPAGTHNNDSQRETIRLLDNVFLRQLDDFSVLDSAIRYRAISGEVRQLNIERLKWRNDDHRHQARGIVSIANTGINSLSVSADFRDFDSFRDISGQFYLSSDNIEIGSWITQYSKKETGIKGGQLSFNAWLTLKHNQPVDGYVQLHPSTIRLSEDQDDQLQFGSGVFKLVPDKKGVVVQAENIRIAYDKQQWPALSFLLEWQPSGWKINLPRLDIGAMTRFARQLPVSAQVKKILHSLNPQGQLNDIRIAGTPSDIRYSAQLTDGAISQWYLLPEAHHLQARISGNSHKAVISADLIDEKLPYGDVFQAPLRIHQGHVNLVWESGHDGWSLWSDKVAVETPDLKVLGAFKLDFPEGKSPFLSFYTEVDLVKAGEVWRYLPIRAISDNLTDYLSAAFQAGQAKTSKLLWYGALDAFPYAHHNGVFQAAVSLKNARFSYDTAWPPLTNLQADILFQNESMSLASEHAELMNVKAQHVTGRIPRLVSDGHIDIEVKAQAKGNDVRDFMTSTPLVDTVGAALTAVQVRGNVQSEFKLKIPFESHHDERAWGWADLKNNRVEIQSPSIDLQSVSGRIYFDNDVLKAPKLRGKLLGQKIALDFNGESGKKGYNVHINTGGLWQVRPLEKYLEKKWIQPLKGQSLWGMGIDLQLHDIGFSYQMNLDADLKAVSSQYPYPLNKPAGKAGKAILQVSGNQETISARVQVPGGKFQTEIDITQAKPVLDATYWLIGNGSFKVSPVVGNSVLVRTDRFNFDQWLELTSAEKPASERPSSEKTSADNPPASSSAMPDIPVPDHVDWKVKELTLATLEWHDVEFLARRKGLGWRMDLSSQEATGKANYIEPYDLSVSLDQLHLYIPALEDRTDESLFIDESRKNASEITRFDRRFHQLMPNLTLVIDDFWFQGYKVGHLNMDFQRQGKVLSWKKIDITSGTNEVHATGEWLLDGNKSHTKLDLTLKGENNSDLMERFGITSGIQKAPFSMTSQAEWEGAPWSMQLNTLKGEISSELGKGTVSDVSGAARLLGIFSLDSIIRKMQLDFSDVFDQGMAFDSIEGKGTISQGVFVTNNISMDAVAGDMQIKGIVDLNTRMIDAEVHFVPDITSGIPVLSAFAVTPQTALYVLAITTVISPVVEVFTEVDYSVKGPIDNPVVKEISRRKGEFKLPEKFRSKAKKQEATK
ncbi:hypothetical protein VA7868_01868 [Vibrio aerogenes CECT 7868]|uniref:YhdP central domain-containing protein n=1 Tax=Vibrio aerogenes CECT 7868 TaxID=1216006 RepID=A0A1M5YM69_9VIBR|nr:YhdP family protein [Vibrio aerogenes]SHI13197.1 hypothetical protein VA7868_01868 [Vibrio aerogenes CECT 7868]